MVASLNDSAAGDARNALILARACELAYYNEPDGSAGSGPSLRWRRG